MKKKKYEKMLRAVQYGETKTVRKALKQGFDPNYQLEKDNYSLLNWAAQGNNADMVRLLVKHGAELQPKGFSMPPLINASALEEDLDMVHLLVELGADVNYSHRWGTALVNAASWGNEAAARFLIDHGANVNGRDKQTKQTPLFFAAHKGHSGMVDLLLAAGADKNLLDKKGRRAADIARKGAEKAIAERNKSIALREAIAERLA